MTLLALLALLAAAPAPSPARAHRDLPRCRAADAGIELIAWAGDGEPLTVIEEGSWAAVPPVFGWMLRFVEDEPGGGGNVEVHITVGDEVEASRFRLARGGAGEAVRIGSARGLSDPHQALRFTVFEGGVPRCGLALSPDAL